MKSRFLKTKFLFESMPIPKELRSLYERPEFERARQALRARSGNRCEWCGARNHSLVYRSFDGSGAWSPAGLAGGVISSDARHIEPRWLLPDGRRANTPRAVYVAKIILTAAHLDHDATHCDLGRMALLCQRCHLGHDRGQHLASYRYRRLEVAHGQGNFFR